MFATPKPPPYVVYCSSASRNHKISTVAMRHPIAPLMDVACELMPLEEIILDLHANALDSMAL